MNTKNFKKKYFFSINTKNFKKIQDNFEKIVITNDEGYLGIQDGIKIIRLVDFLLDENIL